MLSVFEGINQQKKRIRTLRRISLLIFPLLICLVENNPSTRAKPIRKLRPTKKVFNTKNKNRIAAIALLPLIPILFLKKKKIFCRLNALTIGKKIITLSSVLKKRFKKLVFILVNSIPVIIARKKALKNTKLSEIGKTGENSENNKNRYENVETNLTQIPYISYPITF